MVRIGKAPRGSSLLADAWHHRSDNGGPFISLAALGTLRRAFHELAEGALSPQDQTKIAQATAAVSGVEDWHNLRTIFSGPTAFLEMHIQADPFFTVEGAHAIASQMEGAVRAALGGQTSVVAHVEPRSASYED